MRRLAILTALVLLAVTTACGSGEDGAPPTEAGSAFAGWELPDPAPAPDFALSDEDGRPVRLSDERGKVVLVTFLYTRCPDVCPLIAESLNHALGELGSDRSSVRVLAVTVDPDGDTPTRVRSYAAIHKLRPEFSYLLGSRPELEPVWRAYDVLAFAADPEGFVEHTAQTVLVDQEGLERVAYPPDATTGEYLSDIRTLLDG